MGTEEAVKDAQKELEVLIKNLVRNGFVYNIRNCLWMLASIYWLSLFWKRPASDIPICICRIILLKIPWLWIPSITVTLSSGKGRCYGPLQKSTGVWWSAFHALAHKVTKSHLKEQRIVLKQQRNASWRSLMTWWVSSLDGLSFLLTPFASLGKHVDVRSCKTFGMSDYSDGGITEISPLSMFQASHRNSSSLIAPEKGFARTVWAWIDWVYFS